MNDLLDLFFAHPRVFGGVAVLSLFVSLAVRKEGALHRRAGWVHVFAMTLAIFAALALGGLGFFEGSALVARDAALRLALLALLAAEQLVFGIRVLQWHGPQSVRGAERLLAAVTGLAGLGGLVWAFAFGGGAMTGLAGALGSLTAFSHLRQHRQTPRGRFRLGAHRSSLQAAALVAVAAWLAVDWPALVPAVVAGASSTD